MSDTTLSRFRPRLRPIRALTALYRILANIEATHEVFRLVSSLDGPVVERQFQRFKTSPLGKKVLEEKRDLFLVLQNRAYLEGLPEGSLGQAYLAFVRHENISPEGFNDAMKTSGERFERAGPDRQRFIYRFRHCHDLLHVITGYGRDFIGELSLLSFTRQHNKSRAFRLLVATGLIKAAREFPGLPVRACAAEGTQLGRQSVDIAVVDWEALLPQQLTEVRRQLKIRAPRRYLTIKAGVDAVDRRYREDFVSATAP